MGALMVISVQVLRGTDGQTRLAYLPRKGGLATERSNNDGWFRAGLKCGARYGRQPDVK
jgi:hypothetical protein